jgi:hypothetical protein
MLKKCIILWVLTLSKIAIAQTSQTVIPFQLTSYNNISIRAILNEKDTVQLMFHTAANAVTLTETATKKLKSLPFDKTIDGIKSWGGSTNGVRMSEHNVLQIEGLTWKDVEITENINSGQFTDGKFGIDLFKDKVIQIDFEKKVIILSENLPKKLKKYKKLKLTFENDMMFVEGNCEIGAGNNVSNKFLIHSGYAGSILLDDKFANDNKFSEKLKIIDEKELKDSYGNVLKTKKAILPAFKIGNQTLTNISVGFFTGAIGRQKISAIGGDVLKRFNWIFDAKREFVYLKANDLKNTKYSNI